MWIWELVNRLSLWVCNSLEMADVVLGRELWLKQQLSRSLSRLETQDIKTQPQFNHYLIPWEDDKISRRTGFLRLTLFSFLTSLKSYFSSDIIWRVSRKGISIIDSSFKEKCVSYQRCRDNPCRPTVLKRLHGGCQVNGPKVAKFLDR